MMASRRDVLPAWSSLPRVVIGHVTEYLDVRALGASACVGQYTLRSVRGDGVVSRFAAGGGVKSAGAAISNPPARSAKRARARGPVAVAEALYSSSPGRSG